MAETYIPEHRNPIHTGTNIRFVKEQPYTALSQGIFEVKTQSSQGVTIIFEAKTSGVFQDPRILECFLLQKSPGAEAQNL